MYKSLVFGDEFLAQGLLCNLTIIIFFLNLALYTETLSYALTLRFVLIEITKVVKPVH